MTEIFSDTSNICMVAGLLIPIYLLTRTKNNILYTKVKNAAFAMFLPIGFPNSVSDDYVAYQIPDTLQGLITYLKGILWTLSFLKGLGIGEGASSQTDGLMQAILVFVARDMTSMIAGLAAGVPYLTAKFGQKKTVRWCRMLAEFLRGVAGVLELMGSTYPEYFLIFVWFATALNSLASVACSWTRSALMTHFAKRGNFADCTAKEGNQDRGVKVFGILIAYVFLSTMYAESDKEKATQLCWVAYFILTVAHLVFNYAAVSALKLEEETEKPHKLTNGACK